MTFRAANIFIALCAMAVAGHAENANEYPSKPVKIIVNVSPGGGVDTATRVIAQRLSDRLKQPFVVENRASASGNLGAEIVFHSEPDGYTLLSSSGSPLAINGWIYRKLNYDPAMFEPIAVMSRLPNVLAVRNDLPATSVKEFITYAKAEPLALNYGSQGTGTASHLTAELFMTLTGAKLTHIPYKGTSPVLNDLLSGHLDCSFLPFATAFELAKGGRLRILGVATEQRMAAMPEVPTLVEVGYPTLVSATWNAISAPPKTPRAILEKLNAEVQSALEDDHVKARFKDLQLIPSGGDLAATKRDIERERQQWGDVVTAAGIKVE